MESGTADGKTGGEVKGHDIAEGDNARPGTTPKEKSGLGVDYGTGVGMGGHDEEEAGGTQTPGNTGSSQKP